MHSQVRAELTNRSPLSLLLVGALATLAVIISGVPTAEAQTCAKFLKDIIEDVPLPDAAVDVVVSNCVINLSIDKPAVLEPVYGVQVRLLPDPECVQLVFSLGQAVAR